MWILVIVAAIGGLGIGIWLGRDRIKPSPSYENRIKEEEERERQKAITNLQKEIENKRSVAYAELSADLERYKAMIVQSKERENKLINEKVAESLKLDIEIEKRKGEVGRLAAKIDETDKAHRQKMEALESMVAAYEQTVVQQKIRIIKNERFKREAELQKLKDEYDTLLDETTAAITLIKEKLAEWSTMERLAYEERVSRDEVAKQNRLMLSDVSVEELKELYGACRKLRLTNPVPLYKAIYDIYFKGVVKELGVRLNATGVCGIYKITNTESGKVYVGQSVNIAERWKQHIKRGTKCDVGTVAGAGLYDAM